MLMLATSMGWEPSGASPGTRVAVTQSRPQSTVASSPQPVWSKMRTAQSACPGRGAHDAQAVAVTGGRDARHVRAVADRVEVLPGLRGQAVAGAVDAASDVQLAATDRPDARVDDGDVGVDVRRRAADRRGHDSLDAARQDLAGDAEAARRSHAYDLAVATQSCRLGGRQARREAGHRGAVAVAHADVIAFGQSLGSGPALHRALASRDPVGAVAQPEDRPGMDRRERDDVGAPASLGGRERRTGQERCQESEAQRRAEG